jgi:hypothetical protein
VKENPVFGSTVLEVAIGIVFLYLFLSLICSALSEYYSALLARRAKHLRESLFALFNHDDPKGLAFLLDFYKQPLVAGFNPQKVRTTPPPPQDMLPGLPWFQKAVVFPARFMAQSLGLGANLVDKFVNAGRWIAAALRDPYEVGSAAFAMRTELSGVTRSTPTYMPDRVFADAVVAVLVDDSGARRRLRDALNEILAGLRPSFQALPDSTTKLALLSQLDKVPADLSRTIDDSTPLWEIMESAETVFDLLLAAIPADDHSAQPVLVLEKAKASMRTAGPIVPPAKTFRDHSWNTIETSLSRLSAAIATLPQGQLQKGLAAKVTWLTTQIGQEKSRDSVTLNEARATIKGIFTDLRGTLDGLKAEIDSSKAADLVERAAQSVAASELDFITVARLRVAVASLPDSPFKATIRSTMDEVGDDLEGLKRNIKIWFNDSMERVSGRYKRCTQVLLTAFALVLTVALNADTLEIGGRLWGNSMLRASVTTAAVAFNTDAQAKSGTSGSGAVVPDAVLSKPSSIQAYLQDELKLPLGWTGAELKKLGLDNETRISLGLDKPEWSRAYGQRALNGAGLLLRNLFTTPNGLTKIMGWALTVIAASMGAPFWFDILDKLVNVRTAANKPEKTTDEPKKT